MATLVRSNGAKHETIGNVDLGAIDAKLRALGYRPGDFTRTNGENPPTFKPVMTAYSRLVLQVHESEPKAEMFPDSGFYFLRDINADKADSLLKL